MDEPTNTADTELQALERAQQRVVDELRSILAKAEALVIKATSLGVKVPLELRTLKLGSKTRKPRKAPQPEYHRSVAAE